MTNQSRRFDLQCLVPGHSLDDSLPSPPLDGKQAQFLVSPQFSDVPEWEEENSREFFNCLQNSCELERALMLLEDVRSATLRPYTQLV